MSTLPIVLKKKADLVLRNAEAMIERTRDWQVIKLYLSNRMSELAEDLTEKQRSKLDRYQFIYNQSVSGKYTESDIISSVMNLFKIERSQAYEDFSCTKEIFTSVININKQFELQVELQVNRKLMLKAEAIGDMKAAATFEKNRVLILSLLAEKEDNPADLFEGHQLEAVFDPALIGAEEVDMKTLMAEINQKRNKDIKTDMFEAIPYVESTDEKENPL